MGEAAKRTIAIERKRVDGHFSKKIEVAKGKTTGRSLGAGIAKSRTSANYTGRADPDNPSEAAPEAKSWQTGTWSG